MKYGVFGIGSDKKCVGRKIKPDVHSDDTLYEDSKNFRDRSTLPEDT